MSKSKYKPKLQARNPIVIDQVPKPKDGAGEIVADQPKEEGGEESKALPALPALPVTVEEALANVPSVADISSGVVTEIDHVAFRAYIKSLPGVEATKAIADRLKSIEDFYTRSKKSFEQECAYAADRILADWACGREIKAMEKAKGGPAYHRADDENSSTEASGADPSTEPSTGDRIKTLPEMGISHDTSSELQKVADITEEFIEDYVATPGEKPTRAGLIRAWKEAIDGPDPDKPAPKGKGKKKGGATGRQRKPIDPQIVAQAKATHFLALAGTLDAKLVARIVVAKSTRKQINEVAQNFAAIGKHIQSLTTTPVVAIQDDADSLEPTDLEQEVEPKTGKEEAKLDEVVE